jgi:ferredoxin--NADP+ reductase
VISRPAAEPVAWRGATGHVQDVWKSGAIERAWGSRPAPTDTHVFICGNPRMAESVIAMLAPEGFTVEKRREPGQIHLEKYWQ